MLADVLFVLRVHAYFMRSQRGIGLDGIREGRSRGEEKKNRKRKERRRGERVNFSFVAGGPARADFSIR